MGEPFLRVAPEDVATTLERLEKKISDHVREDAANFAKVFATEQRLQSQMGEMKAQLHLAIDACQRAANHTLEQRTTLDKSMSEIRHDLDRQMTKILRLIGSDAYQDQKLEQIERATKSVADMAISRIESKSNEAARGLSRKISVPVGTIAAASTIIQWIVNHYFR